MRKWRKVTWVLILWCALILVSAVAGAAGNECDEETGDAFLTDREAEELCEAGTGLGVAALLFFGFFGFVFFAIIWYLTRPKVRTCPRCGEDVKKGVMTCRSCGFDFNTVGGPVQPPEGAQ